MCKSGLHDKRVTGTVNGNRCKACFKEYNKEYDRLRNIWRRQQTAIKRRNDHMCKKGLHDLRKIPPLSDGRCRGCKRDRDKRYLRQRKIVIDDPRVNCYIPHLLSIRREFGLTQEQLANRASLSPTTIGAIENGKQKARRTTQEKLVRAIAKLDQQRRMDWVA